MAIRRWLRRAVLAIIALIAVATVLVWLAAGSAWGRERARRWIETQAAVVLDGTLSIGAVGGDLWRGLQLVDVRFVHGGQEVVRAARLDARYDVWRLLRGGDGIGTITLVEPLVALREAGGKWNATEWVRPRASGGAGGVRSLPSISVVNGRVTIEARERMWRLPPVLDRVTADLRLVAGPEPQLTIQALSFVTEGWTMTSLTGAVHLGAVLRLDRLTARTSAGTVALSGTAGPDGAVALDLALTSVDTAGWRRVTPLLDAVSLTADGQIRARGRMDALAVDAALRTSAGQVTSALRIDAVRDTVRIHGTADLSRVDLAAVTTDEAWRSTLTGRATFDATAAGTPTAWTATFGLAGGPVGVFETRLDRVEATGAYTPARAGQRAAVTFRGRVAAYGASAVVDGVVRPGAPLDVAVHAREVSGVDPRRLPNAWGMPAVEARLAASRVEVEWLGGAAPRWRANVTLDASTVEGGTIATGATITVASTGDAASVDAAAEVRDVDVRRLGRAFHLAALDDPRLASRMAGTLSLHAVGTTWAGLEYDASAQLTASTLTGVRTPGGRLGWSLHRHAHQLTFAGTVADMDPVALGLPAGFEGRLNGRLDVTSRWRDDAPDVFDSMTAGFTLDAVASHFARTDIDRGRLAGRWAGGELTAETLDLEGEGLHVTGQGRLGVLAGTSDASFTFTAADVKALEPWTGRDAHGAARGNGTVRGAFDAPRIIGAMQARRLDDTALGVFTSVDATLDGVLPDWDVERIGGPVEVRAAEWTDAGRAVAQAITVRGPLTTWTSMRGAFTASTGAVALTGEFLADWSSESRADVTAFTASSGGQTWRLDPARGPVRISETHIEAANAMLVNGRQRVAVSGALAFDAVEPRPVDIGGHATDRLSLHAEEIDLAALVAFLGTPTRATGIVSADGTLIGRLNDPRGRLAASARQIVVDGYAIAEITGVVGVEAGRANVTVGVRQADGVLLNVAGRVPLAWALPADALDGAVPVVDWDLAAVSEPIGLAILAPMVPMVEAVGGEAIVDLRVIGAAADPRITGTLAVTGGAFRVRSLGTSYSEIRADLGFSPDAVTVRTFSGRDQHGHPVTLKGRLAVAGRQLTAFNVSIEADRLSVVDNAVGTMEVSSLLQLAGTVERPSLTGNVEVATGRVEVDRLLRVLQGEPLALVAERDLPAEGDTRVDLRSGGGGDTDRAAAPPPTSWLSRLAMDVVLFAPDNLTLRGSRLRPGGRSGWSLGDINVTVGGELSAARGPGERVRLRGDVTMVRGAYAFEGRRFDLVRGGRIRFQGDVPADPLFDIRGVRTIQGIETRVDVRGRLSAPELVLGANVPIEPADVLSMIIFNRPVNQLGETQRAGLVDAAASLAGGLVASPIAGRIGRALDLDVFEVESIGFGQGVAPRIRVGERLGQRLYLQLSQQFGAQSVSEVTAEYQLASFLRLQARTAQGPGSRAQRSLLQRVERAGLDLLFFFSY